MGAARDDQDPHERHGYVPKLILAGRLSGTLDGRPVVIDADDSGITLSVTKFWTAWNLRGSVQSLLPALRVLNRCGVPVRFGMAGFSLEVLPRPSVLVRMVVPALSYLG